MGIRKKAGKKPGFHIIVSFGCSRRPLQCGQYSDYLVDNGWRPVGSVEEAALILIYTCGGFQETEDRGLATIKRVRAVKQVSARLVITGCLLKINPPVLGSAPDLILPEDLDILDEVIQARFKLADFREPNTLPPLFDLDSPGLPLRFRNSLRLSPGFLVRGLRAGISRMRQRKPPLPAPARRWYLRIAHGLLGECSYCSIKIACGRLCSKPAQDILAEFRLGHERGYRDFVILAEDTGCYGQDIGTDIISLLETLMSEPGDFRFIIKDYNPGRLIRDRERLISLLEKFPNRLKDLRMPIQSGSDIILKKMRRPYRIEDVRAALQELKRRVPECPVYTHFIVGFPGETREYFAETEALMREFDFADTEIYLYEGRPGTEAIAFRHQVPERVKRHRKRRLERIRDKRQRAKASLNAV